MGIEPEYQASYTATAATASIATGGNINLHTVNIPKATVGTLSFQDISNNVYFVMPTGTAGNTYIYDAVLNNGLQIVASSASDQIVTTWKRG